MIDIALQYTTLPDQILVDKSDSFGQEGSAALFNLDSPFDSMNPPTTWQHSVQMSLLGMPAASTASTNADLAYASNGNYQAGGGYAFPTHNSDAKRLSSADSVASFSDQQSNFDGASPHDYDNYEYSSGMSNQGHQAPMPVPQRTQTESVWQRRLQSRSKQADYMDLRRSTSDFLQGHVDGASSAMYPADPQGTDAALAFQQFPAPFGIPRHHQQSAQQGQLLQHEALPPPPPPFQSHSDESNSYSMSQINNITGYVPIRNNDDGVAVNQSARPSPYDPISTSSSLAKNSGKQSRRRAIRGGLGREAQVDRSFDPSSKKPTPSSSKGVISKVVVPSLPGSTSDAINLQTGEAGSMRHMCPFEGCDKHFSTSGHARRHSRIHDCLRPFECPHANCNATFTRRDNCTQHQRARHQFQLVAHRTGAPR